MLCRNYNRAGRGDGQLSQEVSRRLPINCERAQRLRLCCWGPPLLAISAKVACLGVLKVSDNWGCTGIEARFQRNGVGPGQGAQQRSNHTHKVIQTVPSRKKSNAKTNVVRILNFKLKKDPGQACPELSS